MDAERDTPASVCDKINEASLVYADALNADLSTYMKRLASTFDLPKSSYTIAPYTYFYYKGFDVDIKNEMIPHSYDEEEPIALYDPDDVDRGRIATNYQAVLDNYAKGWRKAGTILGLVGITMVTTGEDDPDDQSAHYVSYVLKRGRGSQPTQLFMFDSAGWGRGGRGDPDEIYYHMIKDALGVSTSQISLNRGIFETGGGESESEYTYVGQNIFCHTWSLWFWDQILGEKLSIDAISAMAGKGPLKNRLNLIRIKTYIYTKLVPTIKLRFLSENAKRLFEKNFKYIFLNKESTRRQIIFE